MSNDLQTGTFRVRGIPGSVDFGISGNGNEQVAVAIEFVDGPNQGRRAVWYGSFTEATEDRTIESLRYLGWDSDDLTDMSGIGNVEAEAVLEEEEDLKGNMRVRVKWINRPRGPAFKNRMDDAQLRAFSARMKGKAVASRKALGGGMPTSNSGSRGSAGRGYEPPPPTDDDIPF